MREVKDAAPRVGSFGERLGGIIDRTVAVLAPIYGSRRMASRVNIKLLEHYSGRFDKLGHPMTRETPSRDSRWFRSQQSIDDQVAESRVELQQQAVEMVQTNPHAAGVIQSRTTHEIGNGLGVRPNIATEDGFTLELAAGIASRLKRVCRHWSRHGADRRRRLTLAAIQRLVNNTYAVYGEAFVRFSDAASTGPLDLAIEVINPMRVETPAEFASDPKVCMGIRYDANDQIAGYYVRKESASIRFEGTAEYAYVPRFDRTGRPQMAHVFEETFPGQTRGLPWLLAAIPFLKDLGDFWESELISKQVEACFSIVVKGGKRTASPIDLAERAVNKKAGKDRPIQDLYPGAVHYIDDDQEITTVDPIRPGTTFAPFVEQTLRAAASALNFPYELLAKNFFRTTYSSGRLAILDGQAGFKIRVQALIDQFLSPLWVRFVGDVFFNGLLDDLVSRAEYVADPHKFEDAAWGGNSFGAVDPQKEVGANVDAVDGGIKTLSEVYAENDQDWSEQMDQRDIELRKEIDLKLAREKYEADQRKSLGLPEANPANPNNQPGDNPANNDQQKNDGNQSSKKAA